MATTEKNILNNWFRTGAKPTQEQFWNWQDSYWHKNDTIPQSQIQDLDTTLANKADSSALDAKANADSSGLTSDNIISWKKALGVGEVPDNIAKIDTDSEQGNVYDKTQVDDLLESSGQNIGNNDLETTDDRTFTQKHTYTHATGGFPYYVTGLPDKSVDSAFNLIRVQDAHGQNAVSNGKAVLENLMASLPSVKNQYTGNYDLGFSEYMVYNPTTGKFAKSDRPQVVNNFPSQINISYPSTIANSNYTPSPTTPQDIRDTFEMIKHLENGYNFTPVTPDMWILRTMADEKISPYSSWRVPRDILTTLDDTLHLKGFNPPNELISNPNFLNSVADNDTFWSVYLNKAFPEDKDWIIRIRNNKKNENNLFHSVQGSFFGLVDEIAERNDNLFFPTDAWTDSPYTGWKGLGGGTSINRIPLYDIFLIKKGSKLSLFIFGKINGKMTLNTIDYQDTMKYLRFGTSIRYINGILENSYLVDVGYWIQN